ncbi:hypothetical protein GG804_24400 [Sphingomonas histidinilytica]|uniref:Phosphotriesterase-related protein n=1 Tax=Rhizorhabdus histidinilytica TaxID=439228 RepID=A0A1T5GAR0_9SPHN|nr:hypothetical protein [Rhizorhabdus histidinilytica]MBO9379918.1 hypothetical protein [Rhizorhabdus histidinilytica]SKC05452.1 phosphotriesterase-related protein [Rhizorhabdus histidinilytica]
MHDMSHPTRRRFAELIFGSAAAVALPRMAGAAMAKGAPAKRPSAVTMRGLVPAADLGITLTHEHVLGAIPKEVPQNTGRDIPSPDAGLINPVQPDPKDLWRFRRSPGAFGKVLRAPMSIDQTIWELEWFTKAGGRTIVDQSSLGIPRDVEGLRQISERTGINFILGTGFYIDPMVPAWVHKASLNELTEFLVKDIRQGVDGYRKGVIGELGIEGPTDLERNYVAAAGRAQKLTGAPVFLHVMSGILPSFRDSTEQLLKIFTDNGGELTKLVLAHQDGSGDDPEYQEHLLRRGIYLSYDTFGSEGVFVYQGRYIQLPQDARRIDELAKLIGRGWVRQLLVSHDILPNNFKRSWGGWGWGHLFDTLKPRFLAAGITEADFDVLVRENPARVLAFENG